MKKYFIILAVCVSASPAFIRLLADPVKKMPCPKCYVMHPEILPLDSHGERTRDTDKISQERTCGECHNTEYINGHNSHYNESVKIGCSECHVEGGIISLAPGNFNADGRIKKDVLRIRVPSDDNCLRCHGVGSVKGKDVFIPDDFPGSLEYYEAGKCFRVTCKTGEILSPENVSDSFLNIKDRETLVFPWDVHLQREVACVSCHFTRNDPRRGETRSSDQDHLANDPRKSYSIGKYLYIPDHDLVHADCRTCHTPEKKHDFLPYKTRHFAVLSCQSCHTPKLYGPALMSVDETVATFKNAPRYEYRGGYRGDSENFNIVYTEGYEPFLISHNEKVPGEEEITGVSDGVSPVNIVVRYHWADDDRGAVPFQTVKRVFMNGNVYRKDIISVFDSDKNGSVDSAELKLDTGEKTEFIRERLAALGVKNPVIKAEAETYRVNHGIAHEKSIKADCLSCHSGRSRFSFNVELASFIPAGSVVNMHDSVVMNGLAFHLDGSIRADEKGLTLIKDGSVKNRYIFGYSSHRWLNVLGFILFIVSLAGAAAHGTIRYMSRRVVETAHSSLVKVKVYVLYERIWHWGMALSVIVLIITGLEVHYAGSISVLGFDSAVDVHNFFAVIVIVNAGLSLFYHAATGEILQYFRLGKGFRGDVIVQAAYYLYGIFRGTGHPFEKSRERRLNPLQQITYVMLLNVLFPVQIITGIMMWLVSVWPEFSSSVNGLTVIAPVHNFFAWLFISFLAVHLYLITTGHTVFSNLKAMITGTEEVAEMEGEARAREGLAGIRLSDIVENIKNITGKRGEA